MAFQLPVTLPSGASGNYFRIGVFEFNRPQRSAYAEVALFASAAMAGSAPRFPLAILAVLELRNEKFDLYFSKAALAAAKGDVLAQFYAAAKTQPLRPINGIMVENLSTAIDV